MLGARATNESDKAFVILMIFCEMIHRKIVFSPPPVATSWLFGKNATVAMKLACWSTLPKSLRVEVVHSIAVPSEDAVAISSPSSEMANESTGTECARSGNPSWALVGTLQK